MKTGQTSTTLLVFTLGAGRERSRRRLLPEGLGQVERSLHEQCLVSAVDAGRECGFRVMISSPTPLTVGPAAEHLPQSGRTFGERLLGAARIAAESGGGPLLVVATDVPGLAPSLLREAAATLAADPERVVVGPSPDGGFYLLGFNGSLDEVLSRVRWRSADARASLLRELSAAGRPVRLLSPLIDLDRRADLELWISSRATLPASWRPTRARLASLLRELRRPPLSAAGLDPSPYSGAPWRGRAPPSASPA